MALRLANVVAGLDSTDEDRAQAREAPLALLARETSPETALRLAEAVAGLDPRADDRTRAREALLALLASETSYGTARRLQDALARLAVTAEDQARAREALLALLASETDLWTARRLGDALAGLSPTVADLHGSDTWQFPPTPPLLAAARQNSKPSTWLAALPLLFRSASTAAESDGSATPNNG